MFKDNLLEISFIISLLNVLFSKSNINSIALSITLAVCLTFMHYKRKYKIDKESYDSLKAHIDDCNSKLNSLAVAIQLRKR